MQGKGNGLKKAECANFHSLQRVGLIYTWGTIIAHDAVKPENRGGGKMKGFKKCTVTEARTRIYDAG